MAFGTYSKIFRNFIADLCANVTAAIDLDTDVPKAALYGNTGTPNQDDTAAHNAYNGSGGAWVTGNEVTDTQWAAGGRAITPTTHWNDTAATVWYDSTDTAGGGTVTVSNVYGCFAGETRVITKDGVQEIRDLSGGLHELMGPRGQWVKSEVRSFGVQPLMAVTVTRNKQRKVIYATPEHRWFVREPVSRERGSEKQYERQTTALRAGARLAHSYRMKPHSTVPSPFGIPAGLVFGDGTRTPHEARIDLYGTSIILARYFGASEAQEVTDPKCGPDMPVLRIRYLPRSFKDLPLLDEGHSYLYGWLAGYFAADGCVSASGEARLASNTRGHLEFVRELCTRIGVGTFGISESSQKTEFGDGPTYSLGLMASTLTPEFFLLPRHRERFEASLPRARERRGWTVVSVEPTTRTEEVYCAVVPEHAAFTLEDNILTGNCLVYDDTVTTPVADLGMTYHAFGAAQGVTAGTFTIVWDSNGIFRLSL